MDNLEVARILGEIADLLEIKSDNPFKIRAYRNGAEIAANHPHQLATLDEASLREIPGIGKDLAARIREIADTGDAAFHRDLLAELPSTVLDLLALQGVGPKTVAALYRDLGIRTLDDLERAAIDGRVRSLRGMGAKKEALILRALEERRQHAGRHLLPETDEVATTLVDYLRAHAPGATVTPVGSLRRGCETCGDIDLLAAGADVSLMDHFVAHPLVERVTGRGDTKSSVLIRGGFQADLRLVAPESRGAALQYFTGSKAHNIALRDRAIGLGFKLNEYGLFRAGDDTAPVAGEREEDVYAALGLDWIAPELREMRGEIDAAQARALPRLLNLTDLRGDLHMHTTETDGKENVLAMAGAAREAGLEYIAVTDHSKSLAMANGMDERRTLAHAARIRSIDAQGIGIRLLAGVECDIKPDGSLDLADDCLAALDLVVASVHSGFNQDHRQMTDRLLRALENPYVDVLGHPTGRLLLRRQPYPFDVAAVIDAAGARGVALEINCQVNRLDLSDVHARLAKERGARLVVSSDAHSRSALRWLRWGVLVARRAWLTGENVINTLPLDVFRGQLRRNQA
ncbi:MAG TPA: DNA polymerase/3'-5' exonuclease PolX [Vicinamibacterales bacterium]|nr:DNA polymerase/3'-5' exonuclease PolX [Vicinamibacterales bacterium]